MSRQVDAENFEDWNEEMIRRYDPDEYHNHPSPVVRLVERRRVQVILHELGARPGHEVLEVGCGAGNILEQVPGKLHGIDISDYILEKARRRLGDRATLIKGDAGALPYDDQSFDRVYCSEVLEHVLDPRQVVSEIRRVLAHNGVAVVSVPNEGLIDRVKDVLAMTGPLGRFILQQDSGGYESSQRMDDEWHLHRFDRQLLEYCIEGLFHLDKLVSVPAPGLPLRYVARLLPL